MAWFSFMLNKPTPAVKYMTLRPAIPAGLHSNAVIMDWSALGKVAQKKGGIENRSISFSTEKIPIIQSIFWTPLLNRNAIFYLIIYQNKKHIFIQRSNFNNWP